jgi:hypothetical protein
MQIDPDAFTMLFTECPLSIKTAVGAEDMQMRIKSQKITKRLNGNNRTRNSSILSECLLEKHL